ncbi:MAG TPA: condensation domain-containing protein, partial [Polyangiaceae bacterium]|nr:condensation domain-containing protein [Polyangiaceae bacterium]
ARVARVAPASIDLSAPLGALGLDSLMAVDVGYAVERSLGVVLPATAFLRGGTGGELASTLLAALAEGPRARPAAGGPAAAPAGPGGEAAGREPRTFPLSAGQASIWLLHELSRASSAYNVSAALAVRGELSIDALNAAFRALLGRHPELVATFAQADDGLVQRVDPGAAAAFRVETVDATGWGDEALAARVSDEVDRPFDLERGPVFRATVFERGPGEHVLALAAHHVVAELWSLVVLLSDLRALYAAARAGAPTPALPAGASYEDFVAWERAYLGAGAEADWQYWRPQLEGVPALELPTDRPRPAVQSFRGGALAVRLPPGLAVGVVDFAKREGTTPYGVLLACFEILLARYSGQASFLVGSPVAGRPRAEFERTVGYFVNPLPLRADLSGEPSVREVVRRAREALLGGLEHQSFPFARAVERLGAGRDPSRSPLFQAMFVLEKPYLAREADLTLLALNAGPASVDFAGLELRPFGLEKRWSRFDLTLSLAQGEGSFAGVFEYNADLFDRATIERLAGHFETLLGAALASPDAPAWRLPLLTEAERHQLLVGWQGAPSAPPDPRCVHTVIEDHAARRPGALAVRRGRDELTYDELNRRANR